MAERVLDRRRASILTVLCVAMLASTLGNTLLNVAIPTLIQDLRASNAELQWILDSYVLAFAGLLLAAGTLGDLFGRRRMLLIGLVIFGAGSLWGTFADTPAQLVVARASMGAGAACIQPLTLSLISTIFPADRERSRAISIWSAVATSGGLYAPLLGGWLLGRFWWGSVFILNVPLAIVAFIAVRAFAPEARGDEDATLDVPGVVLSIATPASLVYAIIEGPERGWSDPTVIAGCITAGLCGWAFVVHQLRRDRPLFDVRALQNRTVSVGSTVGLITYFFTFGTSFFVAQYLQLVLGHTPLETGVRLIPSAAALTLVAPISSLLVERFGIKRVMPAGLICSGCGLLLLRTATETSGYTPVLFGLFLQGAGMGMCMVPMTSLVMGALPRARAGMASAVQNTTRQFGAALGIALVGSLVAARYSAGIGNRLQGTGVAEEAKSSLGAALRAADRLPTAAARTVEAAARHSFVDAIHAGALLCAFMAFAGAVMVTFLLPDPRKSTEAPSLTEELESTAASVAGVPETEPT